MSDTDKRLNAAHRDTYKYIVDGDHSGNGNGTSNGKAVPVAKARLEAGVLARRKITEPLPVMNGASGDGGSDGTGPMVRPVKARVGNGHANGNGHTNGHAHNGNSNGYKALLGADTLAVASSPTSTSRLRDTDLNSLRLRLKTGEWDYTLSQGGRKSSHKRPLPYFLMRHRNLRARSRVGHVRTQVSVQRFGKGGPVVVVARLLLLVSLLSFVMLGSGVGAAFGGAAWYLGTLPPVDPNNPNPQGLNGQTTKIYDRNGTLLFDLVDEKTGMRQEVPLKDISPLVISATVAAEDGSFYTNPGIDFRAIGRAFVINNSGEGQSGASTITQQLARQTLLSAQERVERTLARKVKEAVLAVQMTRAYSKDEIMEMFLNQNYYGHRAYGIGAAAFIYFGKSPKDLTLPEAALLAGLPQAPSEFDPIIYPIQAERRQEIVLDLMAKQGMISQAEAKIAKSQKVELKPYQPDIKAPHFVYYVKEYLEKKYGPDVGTYGLKVTTTLDLNVQAAAEKVARDRIEELRRQSATNASIVVMKPGTGEILAMVGSVDYYNTSIDGQVNVATRERQPGSSFKPIAYVTAFKKGWTPGTVVLDTLTSFPNPGQKPYIPKNYDGRDHGYVTVRDSLANSYNIPAVKALQFAGIQDTIDTAHDIGIQGLNRGLDWYGLSLTLGGGEVTLLDMTTAYSTFANGGVAVPANPILKIERPGIDVVEQLDPDIKSKSNQALDTRLSYMITSILTDNRARTSAFGPDSPLKLSFPAAAKTGTTDENRDSWTMGYTPSLTVGVWVGNSNNAEMQKVTGAIGAAVIWHNMMETFYNNPDFVKLVRTTDGKLQEEFVQPDGLIKMSACSARGGITDWFLKEAPPKGCVTYKDPKTNQQLHSAPADAPSKSTNPATRPQNGTGNGQGQQQTQPRQTQPKQQAQPTAVPFPQPRAKPTPLPGIWPPIDLSKP